MISCYNLFLFSVIQSEIVVDYLGLDDEIESSVEDDIHEDKEETARMEELNKDLPPGYEAGYP